MYNYETLQNDDDIRLIELPPAALALSGSKLNISLLTFAHRDTPNYEALSYVWGDPSNPVTINVNGQDMLIGRNLHDALTHIRHEHQSRKLWIDAICINQSDNNEKSKQVSRMRDIYSNSTSTVMWIGMQDGLQAPVLEHIRDIHDSDIWMPKSGPTMPALSGQLIPIPGPLQMMFGNDMLTSLGTLWDQTYFSRSWITQEIAVSAHLVLVCGTFQFDFDRLMEVSEAICDHSTIKLRNHDLADSFISIRRNVRQHIDEMEETSGSDEGKNNNTSVDCRYSSTLPYLLQLLSVRRDQNATDARDKVYAFLGIARDSKTLDIQPHYSMSANELYTAVAAKLIDRYGPSVLSTCQPNYSTLGLPSWVPDWSQPWRDGIERRDIFECGTSLQKEVRMDTQDGTIAISGIVLDVVRGTDGTPFDTWGPEPWKLLDMPDTLEEQMTKI
ncbi:Ff.00g020550.m01.CDS01 [Fusarium sp. VM40]|nr:Ff.00g020550.m01.CDS01 [Fusarium sp. VM40]